MRAINIKLCRDLWHIRGQAMAIILVITAGIATYIMFLSTLDSLRLSQSIYYDQYRFSDVFSSLKRAPESLRNRIQEILALAAWRPGSSSWSISTYLIFPSRSSVAWSRYPIKANR